MSWPDAMTRDSYAKFKNDLGVPEIRIGVKEVTAQHVGLRNMVD